jgi:hypothetical protein
MFDFDVSNVQDDDGIEITDLDSQSESSSTSLSIALLKFARKIPFLANTRAKSTALSLLMCGIMLLFLVQPGLPSIPSQASGTPVFAASYSQSSIERFYSKNAVVCIKLPNGILVKRKLGGTIAWQGWYFPNKYPLPKSITCG